MISSALSKIADRNPDGQPDSGIGPLRSHRCVEPSASTSIKSVPSLGVTLSEGNSRRTCLPRSASKRLAANTSSIFCVVVSMSPRPKSHQRLGKASGSSRGNARRRRPSSSGRWHDLKPVIVPCHSLPALRLAVGVVGGWSRRECGFGCRLVLLVVGRRARASDSCILGGDSGLEGTAPRDSRAGSRCCWWDRIEVAAEPATSMARA
jgi:hypothetical protein